MSIARLEKATFGQPLTPLERVVGGLVTATFTAAHAILGATALLFLYVLVTLVF